VNTIKVSRVFALQGACDGEEAHEKSPRGLARFYLMSRVVITQINN